MPAPCITSDISDTRSEIATQALAHIDSSLAFTAVPHLHDPQSDAGVQTAILNSTVCGRSETQDFDGFWQSVQYYLGDVSFFDPASSRRMTRCFHESIGHLANHPPKNYASL